MTERDQWICELRKKGYTLENIRAMVLDKFGTKLSRERVRQICVIGGVHWNGHALYNTVKRVKKSFKGETNE